MGQRATSSGNSKIRAVIEAAIAIAVGVTLYLTVAKVKHLGIVICCVGLFVLVSGLFIPKAYRGFKKLGLLLGKVVGVAMAWLLLVPFFYLCFGLGRAVLLVARKDPLCREFPTEMPTYWVSHGPKRATDSYTRQY